MLAIIPGYDGSGSDETSSEAEEDDNSSLHGKNKEPDGNETDSTRNGIQNVTHFDGMNSNVIENCQATRCKTSCYDGEGSISSPKLNTEQQTTLKFLALMKRKEEELKEMKGIEDLPSYQKRKRRRRKPRANYDQRMSTAQTSKLPECESNKSCDAVLSQSTNERTEQWTTLQSFIGVNDHLKGSQVDHGDLGPKSGLEKRIDQAAADGDIEKAEQLSDLLAKRDFAVRIAEAANARDYSKRKQEDNEMKQAKRNNKTAKLSWGFEVKHRWEMKGNM